MDGARKEDERDGDRVVGRELPPGVSPATVRNASRLPMFMQGWATRNHRRRHPLAVIVICIALVLNWAIMTRHIYAGGDHWLMSHTSLPAVYFAVMVALLGVSIVLGVRASRRVLRTTGELVVARQRYLVAFAGSHCVVCAVLLYGGLAVGGDIEVLAWLASVGLLIAGLGLLVAVFSAARRGSELRCAGCGYSFDYESGEVCSECGRDWLGEGGLVRGGRRRGWARPAILFAVFVLPAVLLGVLLSFTEPIKHLPTGLVMRMAESRMMIFDDAWRELKARQLTDEEVRRLIERLINRPWESRFPEGSRVGEWLREQVRLNKLPNDLREQIIADMVEIELIAPSVVRAGSEAEVRVEVRTHPDRWPHLWFYAAFGGYTVDGSTTPLDRAERIYVVHSPVTRAPEPGPLAGPLALRPELVGTVRVSVDCWLLLCSYPPAESLSWRPDGTPDRWGMRFATLHVRQTATIRVRPSEEP